MSARDEDWLAVWSGLVTKTLDLHDRLDDQRAAQIDQLHAELADVRDGMVALGNRIEAVSRAVGGGLHSVKA